VLARSDRELAEQSYVDLVDVVTHVAAQQSMVRATAAEAPVMGSPVLLERLVQNLVENGVRHNIAEGGWAEVTTGTRPDGRVEPVVTNTGPVVPRYEIPGLFEPFRRLTTDRVARNGVGLGLSVVRAVASTRRRGRRRATRGRRPGRNGRAPWRRDAGTGLPDCPGGNVTVTTRPPAGLGVTSTDTSWAVAMARTIDSPSPTPAPVRALERLEEPLDRVRRHDQAGVRDREHAVAARHPDQRRRIGRAGGGSC
jgi:hypothetical protein